MKNSRYKVLFSQANAKPNIWIFGIFIYLTLFIFYHFFIFEVVRKILQFLLNSNLS